MNRFILLSFMVIVSNKMQAQLGGEYSYDFLNIPTHARLAALGGANVSHVDKDQNFLFSNPALVSDTLAGWASASYLFYVADIGQASFAYTHSFKKIGTLSFGVQHIGYGDIDGYDFTGAPVGSFTAGETNVVISKSHQVSQFRLGLTTKFVFSNLAGFNSSAVLFDIGGVFIHPEQELTVGLVIKNFGFRLSDYTETSNSNLPFDVQAGVTFKPKHMPLRFSVTAFNLVQPGDVYDAPDDEENAGTLDKVMSHFNFGAEILLHPKINALIGYNFLKQSELKANTGGGGSGFTYGLAVMIKSIDLSLSSSRYSRGNSNYTFSLAANMEQMIFKKRTL